jgi:hypothetical protein
MARSGSKYPGWFQPTWRCVTDRLPFNRFHSRTTGNPASLPASLCKVAVTAQRLHETTRFVREDDRWIYAEGMID